MRKVIFRNYEAVIVLRKDWYNYAIAGLMAPVRREPQVLLRQIQAPPLLT
jgi:hypothetical protein